MFETTDQKRITPRSQLVGGIPTLLKNMLVKWDYSSQYMESHKIPWFQTTNQ